MLPVTDAVVYVMPAPFSYTREDVVELHLPGALPFAQFFLERCIALGARIAAPGEMTRRAFLAGRIDLLQAESVAALIDAESEQVARRALAGMSGFCSSMLRQIAAELIHIRASLEAGLDFVDQDIDPPDPRDTVSSVKHVEQSIADLLGSSAGRDVAAEGIRVVLVGSENAGKSTLFNALSAGRRTIVSHRPGTTRDVIEGSFTFGRRFFRIFDTAGVSHAHIFAAIAATHSQRTEPEDSSVGLPSGGTPMLASTDKRTAGCDRSPQALGVISALTAARTADIVVLVVDASGGVPCTTPKSVCMADKERLVVALNKVDLVASAMQASTLRRAWDRMFPAVMLTSGLHRKGILRLKRAIVRACARREPAAGGSAVLVDARQKEALESARGSCEDACRVLEADEGAEVACLHLQEAYDRVAELLGFRLRESVLDSVFSRFCVGK